MWPEVDGLVIKPEEAVVAQGGLIRVALDISVVKIGVDAYVTECRPGEVVRIEGQSSLVDLRIALELDDDEEGTRIAYGLELNGKKLSVRLAEPALKSYLSERVPPFVAGYRERVSDFLRASAIV